MKILLIRFSSIGDIVLTTPIIRCLKKQLGADLHFVTKDHFKEILIANPYLVKIHGFKDNLSDLVSELKKENFDLIIDLHKNLRSSTIIKMLGVTHVSFHKLNFKKWLVVNTKIDLLPEKHLVDRYFEALVSKGITNDGNGLDYHIRKTDHVEISELSDNIIQNDFIAIAFGTAHYTKSIPENKLVEIINQIDSPIVLLGGKAEMEIGEKLTNKFPGKVCHGCGKLSINQSASVIEQSKILLTADTGMMHIAAALKKKMIVLWGSTIPAFGMYPYGIDTQKRVRYIENKELKCRPCSKIGYDKCPQGHFKCMNHNFRKEMTKYLSDLAKN